MFSSVHGSVFSTLSIPWPLTCPCATGEPILLIPRFWGITGPSKTNTHDRVRLIDCLNISGLQRPLLADCEHQPLVESKFRFGSKAAPGMQACAVSASRRIAELPWT